MSSTQPSEEEKKLRELLTASWKREAEKDDQIKIQVSKIQDQERELAVLNKRLDGNNGRDRTRTRSVSLDLEPGVLCRASSETRVEKQADEEMKDLDDKEDLLKPIVNEEDGDTIYRCASCSWELDFDSTCVHCGTRHLDFDEEIEETARKVGRHDATEDSPDEDAEIEGSSDDEEEKLEEDDSLRGFTVSSDDEGFKMEVEMSEEEIHSDDCSCEELDLGQEKKEKPQKMNGSDLEDDAPYQGTTFKKLRGRSESHSPASSPGKTPTTPIEIWSE